jgi:putative nucleotidyltransferase with HDIG domain
MVNVSALAMAQARALNIDGPLLREFGFAALMHDIGKVNTPLEVLNKPGKLTNEEFDIMKRHVVDGAHILRRTPEMPALAPIVAFEHHLKQDLSGYPEKIGSRKLNLCTMIVDRRRVRRAAQQPAVSRGHGDGPHPQHHGGAGQPRVQPGAAEALRQPDGAVSGRQPGPPRQGRSRRGHRRAPDRSVPAAGQDHHGRRRARCSKSRC